MTTATIVATYVENGMACVEVVVDEGEKDANGATVHHVYTGRVPVTSEFQALTNNQKRLALAAAVRAERDAQRAGDGRNDLGLSGNLTL